MSISLLFLTAIILSLDAIAVTVAVTSCIAKPRLGHALRLAFCFGMFQALMPFLGWLCGELVYQHIMLYGPWVSLLLLSLVGLQMIYSALKDLQVFGATHPECDKNLAEACKREDPTKGITILYLGIATSLDAMAVGVSLAMVKSSILLPMVIIGGVCFCLTMVGTFIGKILGKNGSFSKYATLVGGCVLIGLGVSIFNQ